MDTSAVTPVVQQVPSTADSASSTLTGEDFFQLLITQLSNQDPLEPTSNEELLQQISSIRDIELSSALTESLKTLTEQQRYASAAGLIGHYITGQADADDPFGLQVQGTVLGVRFTGDGKAVLQLEDGSELPLEQVERVVTADNAAGDLVGTMVTGLDTSDPNAPQIVQGLVTNVRIEQDGTRFLELDTGEELKLQDVLSAISAETTVDESA